VPYILQYLAKTQQAILGLSPADVFCEGHTYAGVIQCGRSTKMMIIQNTVGYGNMLISRWGFVVVTCLV
jgi:hypothetical protein